MALSNEVPVAGSIAKQLSAYISGGDLDALADRLRALMRSREIPVTSESAEGLVADLCAHDGILLTTGVPALLRVEALVELASKLDARVPIMVAIWDRLGQTAAFPLDHLRVLGRVYEDARFVAAAAPESLAPLVLGIVKSCDQKLTEDDLELFIEDGEPTTFCYETVQARLEELGTLAPGIVGSHREGSEAETEGDEGEDEGQDEDEQEEAEASDPVRATVTHYNVKTFFDYVEANRLDLAPPWQRQDVWSLSKKRELIRSLLLGIPLPSVILHKRGEQMSIIDGKQRLNAIIHFMRNVYKLPNFDVSSTHPLFECRGAWFNRGGKRSLREGVRTNLELRMIPVLLFEEVSERRLRQIFHLYNVSGTRLNAAEIRNAVYQSNRIHRVAYVLAGEARTMPEHDLGTGNFEEQLRFTETLRRTLPTVARYAAVAFLCRYLGYSRAAMPPGERFRPSSTSSTINRYFDYASRDEEPEVVARDIMRSFLAAERIFDFGDDRLPFHLRNNRGQRKFNALVATANMVAARFLMDAVDLGVATEEAVRHAARSVEIRYPDNQQTSTIWDYQAQLLIGLRDALGVDVGRLGGGQWLEFFDKMAFARLPEVSMAS